MPIKHDAAVGSLTRHEYDMMKCTTVAHQACDGGCNSNLQGCPGILALGNAVARAGQGAHAAAQNVVPLRKYEQWYIRGTRVRSRCQAAGFFPRNRTEKKAA